jgi:hypothetical protein
MTTALTTKQVASMLGVTEGTVRYLRAVSAPLPYFKIGGRYYYETDDVLGFIAVKEKYRNRLLAQSAPPELRQAFSPHSFDLPQPT